MRRVVALDLTGEGVHAVQAVREGGVCRVERACAVEERNSFIDKELTAGMLGRLVEEHGFCARAGVAVALPAGQVFFRRASACGEGGYDSGDDCSVPLGAPERLGGELGDVTAFAGRSYVDYWLAVLAGVRRRCVRVDTGVSALLAMVYDAYPPAAQGAAVVVYEDGARLVVVVLEDGAVRAVRQLPGAGGDAQVAAEQAVREVELTWRAVFGSAVPEGTRVVTAGSAAGREELETCLKVSLSGAIFGAIGGKSVHFRGNPVHFGKNSGLADNSPEGSQNGDGDEEFVIARGLAMQALGLSKAPGVNLLTAREKAARPDGQTRRPLQWTAVLAGLVAAIFVAGLFLRLGRLEGQYTQAKTDIRAAFLEALPGETTIVDEAAQMQEKLAQLRGRHERLGQLRPGSIRPVELWHELAVSTPAELGIRLEEMWVTPTGMTVTASCGSFTGPYEWERALRRRGAFRSVRIDPPQKVGASEAVRFTATIEIKREE